MAEPRLPIFGTKIPPMLGRRSIMGRLWRDLTKTSPSHISVVGPRYAGKSVLLNALSERIQRDESPYAAVVLWDLGHHTPNSDEAFLVAMSGELAAAIAGLSMDYAEHLRNAKGDRYGELREVLEHLDADNRRVLMLWDGFDKPLGAGTLTRNLWDRLRELASSPALRLVTATRRTLHELIRSEESVTSDFWNIFDANPARLGVFDDEDCEAVLAELPHMKFDASARKELCNWSGAFPPLYVALLNELASMSVSHVDNEVVNKAAERVLGNVETGSILSDLWDDCPQPSKDVYWHLCRYDALVARDVGKPDRLCLEEKGFVACAGNKLESACRLLQHHLDSLGEDAGSLVRMFGPWEQYCGNIRGLLELRLEQLTGIDDRLRRLIARSLEDVPDYPNECLTNLRGIADRALDLIWDSELGPTRSLDRAWFGEWQFSGERGSEARWNEQFPRSRGHQCRLLQLLTGTQQSAPKAKYVSKNTYALVNAVQGLGDFGQHMGGLDVSVGTAVTAMMTCLELAACLEHELP